MARIPNSFLRLGMNKETTAIIKLANPTSPIPITINPIKINSGCESLFSISGLLTLAIPAKITTANRPNMLAKERTKDHMPKRLNFIGRPYCGSEGRAGLV